MREVTREQFYRALISEKRDTENEVSGAYPYKVRVRLKDNRALFGIVRPDAEWSGYPPRYRYFLEETPCEN